FFGGDLEIEGTGLTRGDFIGTILAQKKRLAERLEAHSKDLDGVTGDPPPSLRLAQAFLTLYQISDFGGRHDEGFDRARFSQTSLEWLDKIPSEDPQFRYALQLCAWVAIRMAYFGYTCGQRVDACRRIHPKALAAEGQDGIPLETSLQALVR